MFNEFISMLQSPDLQIEFVNQWVFWLLPVPVLVYYFASAYRENTESVQIASLADLTADSTRGIQKSDQSKKRAYILLTIIWLGLLTTVARPERIIVGEQKEVSVRDILLVLDISGSMAIRDMQGETGEPGGSSRMEVMQQAVSEFINKREYDNIGLVIFGSQALLLTPVSQDHNALLEQIDEMVPGMAGPQTSIGDAIGVAIKTYRQMDTIDVDKQKGLEINPPQKEHLMVLLTDGLDTSSVLPPRVALRLATKQQVTIHTIAFGDTTSEDSNNSIDLKLLEDIAKQTNGSFHQASESVDSLKRVYSEIDRLEPRKVTMVANTQRAPVFTYPLLLSLLVSLLLLTLSFKRGSGNE